MYTKFVDQLIIFLTTYKYVSVWNQSTLLALEWQMLTDDQLAVSSATSTIKKFDWVREGGWGGIF